MAAKEYEDLINIMRDGGVKICDQAIEKWCDPACYSMVGHAARIKFIDDWKDTRNAIQVLAIKLKQEGGNGR